VLYQLSYVAVSRAVVVAWECKGTKNALRRKGSNKKNSSWRQLLNNYEK
jgi:hypothetical protein